MWPWLVVAPVVSAAGTWAARGYARRRRLVDEPGERRSHAVATPRGGGIGPVVAIALLLVGFGIAGKLPGADWRWLVGGLLLVAGVGAWDDHRPLGALPRLVVHLLAGVCVAVAFGIPTASLAGMLVVLAVASMVNIWNFMDGIDGIAATQATLLAVTVAVLASGAAAAFALAVGLAVAAFVPFNFPRATVFLGDVGSGALGFVAVVLALSVADGPSWAAVLVLLPASAFVVDASMTLARRMADGERWWTAHTRHLYQACARRFGHVRVTLAYAAWTAGSGVLAWGLRKQAPMFIVALLIVWYTTAAALWVVLQRRATRWSTPA